MHAARTAAVVDGLHAALDGVLEADLAAMSDRELLAALEDVYRAQGRVAAAKARLLAEVEARGAHGIDGAQSASQWVAHRCRIPGGVARHDVLVARSLRHLPATMAKLADGDISELHASRIAHHHHNPRTTDAMEHAEATLAAEAARLTWPLFQKVLAYWAQLADVDGTDDDAEARRNRRRAHLSQTYEGMWVLDGLLDPVAGSILDTALRRIEDELYDIDRLNDTTRLRQQRRADALIELAKRAMSTPADARRPAPLVSILVGYETFAGRICELADGTVLAPSDVTALLDEAIIERAVFDGPSRVLDLGRQRRFTGALRRALELRDRTCTHPYCDAPAWRCDGDHRIPYAAGGPTTENNGRLGCPFHNHLRQRRGPPD